MSTREEHGSEASRKDRVNTGLKAVGCLCFVLLTLFLWLMSESWIVYLLLLLPYYALEEWLSSKLFVGRSRWSTAEAGFSVLRILYGVILALLFFGAVYCLTLIGRWVF